MNASGREYVFLGLSITSTWGNGHATTYRALLKELAARGHSITFLERDVPWYAENREFDSLPYCCVELYKGLVDLKDRFSEIVRRADAVIVGSYVPEGIEVGQWVQNTATQLTVFYDIDTPVTIARLEQSACEYLRAEQVAKYRLYLSFTGGPLLRRIETRFGSPCARPLYCSVDPSIYFPDPAPFQWDLAYLGTYAEDRQPALERFLLEVAPLESQRQFVVAGPQYPADVDWPENVTRIEHLPASEHRKFYNSQRFCLNLTRQDMVRAGYSPSVRLFEAAACGVVVLSDAWPGLSEFFEPGRDILLVRSPDDVRRFLEMPAEERHRIASNARQRTLLFHTATVRAAEFDARINEAARPIAPSHKWKQVASQTPVSDLVPN